MAKCKAATNTKTNLLNTSSSTLLSLRSDPEIWFKIKVLLYDLHHIANDQAAESRTLATTDELYISGPYFSTEEANLIKATLVTPPTLNEIPEFGFFCTDDSNEAHESSEGVQTPEMMSIEEVIKSYLQNFFEKRRASGDARPCGPHDLGIIYRAVFGLTKEDLKDEKFLSRLRKVGLGQSKEKEKTASESIPDKRKKKKGQQG